MKRNRGRLTVDLSNGEIKNETKKEIYHAKPFPPFILELIESGGLVEYTRHRLMGQY